MAVGLRTTGVLGARLERSTLTVTLLPEAADIPELGLLTGLAAYSSCVVGHAERARPRLIGLRPREDRVCPDPAPDVSLSRPHFPTELEGGAAIRRPGHFEDSWRRAADPLHAQPRPRTHSAVEVLRQLASRSVRSLALIFSEMPVVALESRRHLERRHFRWLRRPVQ